MNLKMFYKRYGFFTDANELEIYEFFRKFMSFSQIVNYN